MIAQEPSVSHVHVAPATGEDLSDVMQIMTSAFDPHFGEAWTRAQCAGILPMSGVSMRVARSNAGDPLGFSLFRTVADEAELLLLAVAPTQRRKGIGRALLQDFIAAAEAEGASKVHLEVRENNPAIQLYSSAGFSTVGRRPNYYAGSDGSRFDALTFARDF